MEQPWKTSSIYDQGRVAEFTLAALRLMESEGQTDRGPAEEVVLEYVIESEHQGEEEGVSSFETLSDALADFKLYLDNRF